MPTAKRYCAYCGHIAHRCGCAEDNSRLRRFLAIIHAPYQPLWHDTPYKRGVPPQVKRRERTIARRNCDAWYTALAERYGARCQHCQAHDAKLTLDHVLPIAKGGASDLTNMQLLCAKCNTAKGKLAYDCRPFSE
jgi:5-methylcytosine-specific restriction endonuclease McrA